MVIVYFFFTFQKSPICGFFGRKPGVFIDRSYCLRKVDYEKTNLVVTESFEYIKYLRFWIFKKRSSQNSRHFDIKLLDRSQMTNFGKTTRTFDVTGDGI